MAMYIFEFEYTFDQDDLSYIWQNLAPREYQKITQQATAVSHELIDAELLTEENLEGVGNLRWMVFKVKQRSQKDYDDIKAKTSMGVLGNFAGATTTAAAAAMEGLDVEEEEPEYNTMYNWPYDYLSFVEKIRLDVEILFEGEDPEPGPYNSGTTTYSGEPMVAAGLANPYQAVERTPMPPSATRTAQFALSPYGAPRAAQYTPTARPVTSPSADQTKAPTRSVRYNPNRSSADESGGGGDPNY